MDRMKPAFDRIRADDDLRRRTLDYVRKHRRPRRYYALAAAAACILVLLLGGTWLYCTPTAQISIDMDTPVTLEINRFDRVISASGSDSPLLTELELTHLNYSDAMDQILASTTVMQQMSDGEVMAVSVIAPEGDQSARLLSEVQACTQSSEGAQCYYADPDTAQDARQLDLPLGKYRVFLELQALDPEITADDVRDLTMRQLRDWIQDLSRQDPEIPPTAPVTEPTAEPTEAPDTPGHHGQGNGNGNGYGHGKNGS